MPASASGILSSAASGGGDSSSSSTRLLATSVIVLVLHSSSPRLTSVPIPLFPRLAPNRETRAPGSCL